MRFPRNTLPLVCFMLFLVRATGQSPNGAVNGLVVDPSNQLIIGAEVIAVNDATRVQYSTKTNNEGVYVLVNLPPGPYRIQVSRTGFKTIIKTDIVLNVQSALSINFTLPVGAVLETVTITGGASLVNSESATVSTVVDRNFAENLPMNGRSFQTLINLTPGVVVTPSNAGDAGQFSVNGQRASSNYWMVDGVSANIGIGSGQNPGNGLGGTLGSFSALGGTNSLVSVDAMQEFRIQTSTYAPEFGRTPGAQISILTRSGTNQFHGTAFDYVRNDVLDANDWFADNKGLPRPEERQNDFGGTLGGPIRKDQTFFFFSYEGLRLRLPRVGTTTVPDDAARQSAVPQMQPYLRAFPIANGPEVLDDQGNPTGTAEFNASYSDSATLNAYSLRIDHRVHNRLNLFARYNYSPSQSVSRGAGGSSALSEVNPAKITTQTATLGAGLYVSSLIANEARINYSKSDGASFYAIDSFGGALPLPSLPFPAGYSAENGLFNFYLYALSVGSELDAGHNARNVQRQINVVDDLSIQMGHHALKLGVDFRQLAPRTSPPAYRQEAFFLSMSSATSGNSDFGFVFSNEDVDLSLHSLSAFAQDTWRVHPRLTITYGVRWDVDAAPASTKGPHIPSVTGYSLNDFSQLGIAPSGTPPFQTTYNNFAPRAGCAYELSPGKTWQRVLRGGFGLFYDLASAETGSLLSFGNPPFSGANFGISGPFPYSAQQMAAPPILAPTISYLFAYNPHLKLPYTLQWNVTFQQALGSNQSLSASYIGASGRRLLQTSAIEFPPSNPNVYGNFVDNTANSSYNALQLQFQRRLASSLQALVSYTWSHSIDTASASSYYGSANRGLAGNPNVNRGSSDFDIRSGFTAGLTYAIPTRKLNAVVDRVLENWSLQSVVQARTAPPVDVFDVRFSELPGGFFTEVRPDTVFGSAFYLYGPQYPGSKALNPAAFTDPPIDSSTGLPMRQGDTPRNSLRGFGAAQWDFAAHRDFPLHEFVKLQFRAELFNLLNHPNFGQPSGQYGASGFGLSSQMLGASLAGSNQGGGALNPLYQLGGPRSIQVALKLFF
jgi:hypothetical protein